MTDKPRSLRLWQSPLAYRKIFDGDIAECQKALGQAQAKLKFMLGNHPGTTSTTYIHIPGVTVHIDTRPNRIRIVAEGGLVVYIPDREAEEMPFPPTTLPISDNDFGYYNVGSIVFKSSTTQEKSKALSKGVFSTDRLYFPTADVLQVPIKEYWISGNKTTLVNLQRFFVTPSFHQFCVVNKRLVNTLGTIISTGNMQTGRVVSVSAVSGVIYIVQRSTNGTHVSGTTFTNVVHHYHISAINYFGEQIMPPTLMFDVEIGTTFGGTGELFSFGAFDGTGKTFLLLTVAEKTPAEQAASASRNVIRQCKVSVVFEGSEIITSVTPSIVYTLTFPFISDPEEVPQPKFIKPLFYHDRMIFQKHDGFLSGEENNAVIRLYEVVNGDIVDLGINNEDMKAHITNPTAFVSHYLFASISHDIYVCLLGDHPGPGPYQPYDAIIKYKGEMILSRDIPITGSPNPNVNGIDIVPRMAFNGKIFVMSLGYYTLSIGMNKVGGLPDIKRQERVDHTTRTDLGFTPLPTSIAMI